MTLGLGTSLVVLAALIIGPMFVKNFIIFQMTMLLIYALAVLALNILTAEAVNSRWARARSTRSAPILRRS
jgi:hypothetical protein